LVKIIVDFFHKKYKCDKDDEKFDTYDELIEHSKKSIIIQF
jgi:hypothetical protein